MKNPIKKIRKSLCSLVSGLALSGLVSGCSEWEEQHRKEVAEWQKREVQRVAEIERKANEIAGNIYSNSLVVANYSVPFVEILSRKNVLSLDIWDYVESAAESQSFSLPVSEEYFNSVSEGQTLSSQFNGMAFLVDGDIEGYSNSISEKKRSNLYLAVSKQGVSEIGSDTYSRVLTMNSKLGDYRANTNKHSIVLTRPGVESSLERDFTDSVKIVLETRKQNLTLDILKHIENGMNSMKFPIEVPAYVGKHLKVGETIGSNFVGASLLFSSSPSEVNYTVVEKK